MCQALYGGKNTPQEQVLFEWTRKFVFKPKASRLHDSSALYPGPFGHLLKYSCVSSGSDNDSRRHLCSLSWVFLALPLDCCVTPGSADSFWTSVLSKWKKEWKTPTSVSHRTEEPSFSVESFPYGLWPGVGAQTGLFDFTCLKTSWLNLIKNEVLTRHRPSYRGDIS